MAFGALREEVEMLTDAELVDGVVAGYDDAFAQLYQRHSLAAWRLGQTVTGNADDASDAVSEAFARVLVAVRAGHLDNGGSFRSYLLTATRNAALDNIRKTGRSRPTEQDRLSEVESLSPTPPELLTGDEEASLVAEAFRNLPERWRSVLWLTEVEGVPTKDAARRLGLSPNGTAQLAVRARSGLRERFLQAHLRAEAEPQCRTTVDRLGAYVGGGLAPRDLAKVDQHLAGCASCESRRRELDDLGSCLRRAAIPAPLAVAGVLGSGGSSVVFTAGEKVARMAEWAQQAFVQKAAAVAAAGAMALGAGGAYVAGSGDDQAASPPTVAAAADPAGSSVSTIPTQSSVAAPAPATLGESAASPPPAVAPAVPPGEAGTVGQPECVGLDLELADAGSVRLGADGLSLSRQSPGIEGGGDRSPGGDDDRRVATLGGVVRPDGFGDDRPESDDIDMDLRLGDLAARLAMAGDLAEGGGLAAGVGVSDGRGAPSPDCAAGAGTGLELSAEGVGSP